jgi:serine/threonine protein kinase
VRPLEPGEPRHAGRYRLVAALGEGGMGRVLLGVAPDGRLVALKQVHPEFAHNARFRTRFRQEVQASQRVSGAFTAAVMDAGPDAETPWLASVFVTGPSLKEAVEATGPLPADAVRRLAAGLAAALTEIHRVGLIHRDLKPGNVLLTGDGPRVIDFGIARAAEGGSDLTGTGGIIGSPAFMSPEQAESRPLTPASDVFSLGGLLVMAATGRGPFTGATTAQMLYNVVHAAPDLTGLAPEIRTLVAPCLAKDPARRPTPHGILDHLGPVAPGTRPWPPAVHRLIEGQEAAVRAALSWPVPEPVPPPVPRPPKRRRWLPVAAVSAAVCALVAGSLIAVNVFGADPAPPSANLDPTSLDTLRHTDPCKVLNGVSITGLGKLQAQDTLSFERCDFRPRSGGKVTLKLGDRFTVDGGSPTGDLDGRLVLFSKVGGSTCDASVQLPAQAELGVTAIADTCDLAKTALGEALKRIRAGNDRYDLAPGTLLALDPCAVLDKTAVAGVAGPVRQVALTGLRECEWTATTSVRLTFEKLTSVPETGSPADVGGPAATRRALGDSCFLTWYHRPYEADQAEHVQIFTTKPGGSCDAATAFGQALVAKLPKP